MRSAPRSTSRAAASWKRCCGANSPISSATSTGPPVRASCAMRSTGAFHSADPPCATTMVPIVCAEVGAAAMTRAAADAPRIETCFIVLFREVGGAVPGNARVDVTAGEARPQVDAGVEHVIDAEHELDAAGQTLGDACIEAHPCVAVLRA